MNPDYDINKFQLPKINAKPWSKVTTLLCVDIPHRVVPRRRIRGPDEEHPVLQSQQEIHSIAGFIAPFLQRAQG